MSWGEIWGEVWRVGISLAGLLAVLGVWVLIIPNLLPFGGTYTPAQVEAEKQRASRYKRLHKFSVRIDIVFFVWLVVEGALLVPYLFMHYGLR